ncbi:MAG: MMPL family transporter [Bacteroidetes bacterium]|jgi:predicted RND superfamily exporter protein|nr:MMPL family transporter [Bacteroidota bacterium]
MHRLFQALRPFIRAVVRHAGVVVIAALVLSALGVFLARNLTIDTDFSNLIPDDYPSVQALERLRETVGGESTADVALSSPSFAANKAFARALIPKALELQGDGDEEPYFTRAEFKRETEFLKDNALYFATSAELDSLERYLQNQIEDAKLEANPFYFDLEDEEEADTTGEALLETYDEIVGKEYFVSPDSTVLVVRLYPAGAQTDIGYIEQAYADLDSLAAAMQPSSYHPEMSVTLGGRMYRQVVEVRAITSDVRQSFGAGAGAVLLFVVLYFFSKALRARSGGGLTGRIVLAEIVRTPVMALVVGLPLVMSLTWTFGLAFVTFETLNLMTSTLGLVLFGLGIDYGIHFYARYTEERAAGRSTVGAAEKTFTSTGQAITVGALTTAAALFVLVAADFKGFSEFGVIAGAGVLFALIAMTVVMPALLAVFERFGLLNLEARGAPPAALQADGRFPAARGVVLASLAVVVAALILLPRVEFEYRFAELEPDYEAWDERNEVVSQAFEDHNRRNPAYVVLDTPEEVPQVVEALRERKRLDEAAAQMLDSLGREQYLAQKPDSFPSNPQPMIDRVESLQDRFPPTADGKQAKLDRIADIRALLDDKFLQNEESEELDKLRRAAQTREPIALEQVPADIKKRFTSKSGEVGNFVIVYPPPEKTLSDGRNSIAFAEDVGTIVTEDGDVYHAGSTSLVAADMLQLMQREAPWMVLATFLIVALLMWANFGSLRWAALALLPLVVGVLWMLLVMELFGLRLNFYNLVVLPAVLGIGNDAGAHLVHRYREEGFHSIRRVLRSTGEHVTMGALTTMIGFGGLLLSFHPGLRSIGELAVVGIGATLLTALLFLPALLQWLEDRGVLHAEPESTSAEDAAPPELAGMAEQAGG